MKQCKEDGAVRQIEHNNNSFYQFNGHSQPWVATSNSEGERGGRGVLWTRNLKRRIRLPKV